MSHNAHFFRIKADTQQQALDAVNGYVADGFEFINNVDSGEPVGVLNITDGIYENFPGHEGWNTEDWCAPKPMAAYLGMTVSGLNDTNTGYRGSWCEEELTDVDRPMGKATKLFVVIYDFHS